MIKNRFLLTGIMAGLLFLYNSCGIYKQGIELKTFSQCNFTVKQVKIVSVAGINLSNIRKITDLPFNDYIYLAKQAFSKKIPSQLIIDIEVMNNTPKNASVNGLDWEFYIKDNLYSRGSINKSISVLPGQKTSFGMLTSININEIIQSKSLLQLLKLIIEKNQSLNSSDLKAYIRIKPWYISGKHTKKYPGFIKIKL